jgi:uncharacterized protein YndB with AHSA1/START domain
MLPLVVGVALAASQWEGKDPDVEASVVVAAPADRIFNYLLDLRDLQVVFPEDCIGKWEMGARTFGEGATAYVRYDMAVMHRRLAMTLTHAIGPSTIDFDHLGNRGFVTRWTLAPEGDGTRVTIRTPLNPPPAPFRGVYYRSVQPEWTMCYQRTLTNLATEMAR